MAASKTGDLLALAQKLYKEGPVRTEPATKRIRVLFDGQYIADTTSATYVWENKHYPQYYLSASVFASGVLLKGKAVDGTDGVVLEGSIKGKNKASDRVLVFEKGPLEGLVRVEFRVADQWFEEDIPIYIHPRSPFTRIDVLPSTRHIKVVIDGVTIAESAQNLFLYETGLRTRYYLPKTSVQWQYITESKTTTGCPYKGDANYYNVTVNGKTHEDVIWWYKFATLESLLIAGHVAFYNEKVDIYIDGVKEEK